MTETKVASDDRLYDLQHWVVTGLLIDHQDQHRARIFEAVRDRDFHDGDLRMLYRACRETFEETGGLDWVSVSKRCSGDRPWEEWAGLIGDLALARRTTMELPREVELLVRASARRLIRLDEVTPENVSRIQFKFNPLAPAEKVGQEEAHNAALDMFDLKNSSGGVSTGLWELDQFLTGKQMLPGWMVVIAGASGHCKSTLAMNMVLQMHGLKILYHSLEVRTGGLYANMARNTVGVNLIEGDLTEADQTLIEMHIELVSDIDIHFEDNASVTLEEIVSQANGGDYDVVVVDYLQLLRARGEFRSQHEKLSYISRELKKMAMDNNLVVIACAQVGRSRDGKMPQFDHIKESGSIGENADVVFMPYYGYKDKPSSCSQESLTVNVAKNRSGRTGLAKLHFDGERLKITDRKDYF